jgi:hypothetical protein
MTSLNTFLSIVKDIVPARSRDLRAGQPHFTVWLETSTCIALLCRKESRMQKMNSKAVLMILCLILPSVLAGASPSSNSRPPGITESPTEMEIWKIVSWLPADTETLVVSRGRYRIPQLAATIEEADDDSLDRLPLVPKDALQTSFDVLPADLLGFEESLLIKHLTGLQVILAVEGSRHFRPPTATDQMDYEGCEVVVFDRDLDQQGDPFQAVARSALKQEIVEGQPVLQFEQKFEYTDRSEMIFLAHPRPNTLLIGTNRNYIREVLARIAGKKAPRALPSDLSEWKFVNLTSRVWAIRHYDRAQAAEDPSSPFGGEKAANIPDEQAVGLTFSFDIRQRTAKVMFLSQDANLYGKFKDLTFEDSEIKTREIQPGIVQISFHLTDYQSVSMFLFVLEGMLGHGLYP